VEEDECSARSWTESVIAACERVLDELARETDSTVPSHLALDVDALRLRMLHSLESDADESFGGV
jgi:hypothetical protein